MIVILITIILVSIFIGIYKKEHGAAVVVDAVVVCCCEDV